MGLKKERKSVYSWQIFDDKTVDQLNTGKEKVQFPFIHLIRGFFEYLYKIYFITEKIWQ